jgi:hypothetical protein
MIGTSMWLCWASYWLAVAAVGAPARTVAKDVVKPLLRLVK